jgi:hypothetical protein
MTVHVYITIDTEEDSWADYHREKNPVQNLNRLERLQRLFDQYGCIPTYLINYPVAMSDNGSVLREYLQKGTCEIGTHCHPWNTPPFEEPVNRRNSMMCNLPDDLILRKMTHLHETIRERFGIRPVCFRAGRWGFGAGVAEALQALGYKVDSSVSPFVDWSVEGGPDYRQAMTQAYRFRPGNIFTADQGGELLEVPPTIGFFQSNFRRANQIRNFITRYVPKKLKLIGILDRLQVLNFRWLSPELSSGKDMVRLAQACINNGSKYLNMSFHSNSMLPGSGPFVKDEDGLNRFLKDIETFLMFAAHKNLAFVPLSAACGNGTLTG